MARALWIAVALAASPGGPSTGDVRFEDRTASRGIDFVHFNAATEEKYMVETMGSGGGFFDFDGDGALDIYLVNGARSRAR